MKNKDLLLSLILVLIVILCGIGLGYLIFRSTDKEINVEILKIDDYTEDIYINGKLIFDNFVSANGVNYKIIDDKVFFSDFGTGGGGNSLYVYNRNGEQLLKVNNDDAFLPNNLLYEYMVYDELNNKIFLFSSIQAEDAQSENISGKYLEELTCSELEYYKDKILAYEVYELLINNNTYKLKSIEKKYLKDWKEDDFDHYENLKSICSN